MTPVLRYAAFTTTPSGGNPAGVVLDAGGLDASSMQRIATEVGYSETAFVWAGAGSRYGVRYFSPVAEVPFCGHATIASAVALADHDLGGDLRFQTQSGEVAVSVSADHQGRTTATLTSVTPAVTDVSNAVLTEALEALGWTRADIDSQLPPRVSFAGAHHLVLGLRSRDLLAGLSYDFERLRALMTGEGWTTAQLVWRESATTFHARVPFPVGGVVEDPATGAAAAALGAYLRELELVRPPTTVTIQQGDDIGRPSLLTVSIDPGRGGIRVSGTAVPLAD